MPHGFAGSYARQPDMIINTRPAGGADPIPTAPSAMSSVPVLDEAGIVSGGAFLVSELEKRDPLIRKPLTSFTYPRDIVVKVGGGWVDYTSAMSVAYGTTGLVNNWRPLYPPTAKPLPPPSGRTRARSRSWPASTRPSPTPGPPPSMMRAPCPTTFSCPTSSTPIC